MKKIILLIGIVILGIAMLLFFLKPTQQANSNRPSTVSERQDPQLNKTHLNSTQVVPHAENQDLQILKPISQTELNLYNIPDIFSHPEKGFLFAFDHNVLNAKQQGDHIQMQMLKYGINRKATITNIEHLDDDIVKFSGRFDDYPEDINHFTISQTLKDQYAIMKIFTDQGVYTAEIKNGVGLAVPITTELGEDTVHAH